METDTDDEIIQKTTKYLTEMLKDVIDYLHSDKEEKNYNFNKSIVNAKLKGKSKSCSRPRLIVQALEFLDFLRSNKSKM